MPPASRPGRSRAFGFAVLGSVCLAVDVAVFNALLLAGGEPVAAKAAAVGTAAVIGFVLAQRWVFALPGTAHALSSRAQCAGFALVNALALAASVSVVGVARYGLGLAGALAINVGANLVATAAGGAVRWWGYARVFRPCPNAGL